MPPASVSSRAKSGHRVWLRRVSASSASSPGSVSTPAASMPAAAQVAPRPAAPRSKAVTAQPAWARRQPMPSPQTPAPTIATRDLPLGVEALFPAVISLPSLE